MKKLLLLAVVGGVTLGSCRTKCPAYSSTKPATQTATAVMASNATASERQ
ncbi:hypothetical protein [Hymenobacter fodinae]|nr:hypothetical protein [Hymenobacter fodinae]